MYSTEVRVETLTVPEWLENYCDPEKFVPLCRECPEYGKNWSCPPGVPSMEKIVAGYRYVHVIGLKVTYDKKVIQEAAACPKRAEQLRRETYGAAKKKMLQALLTLEEVFPQSLTIMAGRCELCDRCTRAEGRGCRHPDKMRFSFSGLGFDLGKISSELLKMPLLWKSEGLPEYNVAIAAFLHSQGC
ncbi:MAG: DUF2284 domain-containing protein [Blautia sp.]|nr:DUF2284 domain-containing protein [Blautia sp.]